MPSLYEYLEAELKGLASEGLYKEERQITSPQNARVQVKDAPRQDYVNLCSNNYLGLANHPIILAAAHKALDEQGFGMASVRFICGTQTLHKTLEQKLSVFLGHDDTILYSSCFDANGGLFETLLDAQDAIISDELNHASVIDGIRLCKAQRYRYKHADMDDLKRQLEAASHARFRMIATDGVFSMDGVIAPLEDIVALAQTYHALVMVDDSHAVGVLGKHNRGSLEHCGVEGHVDLVTGTLGKALGGASGGYTSGKHVLIQWLRQRSRPYLFSNTLAPVIAGASLKVLDMLTTMGPDLRQRLDQNTAFFRKHTTQAGFTLAGADHPIIPVMLGDALLAKRFAEALYEEGIYVSSFTYPVVPRGKARIRTQMSASHSVQDLEKACKAFIHVGRTLGVIS